VSWNDPETGMFHENYAPMYEIDPGIVDGMFERICQLIETPSERKRLGANARRSVKETFNFENWNAGLKKVFDEIANGMNGQ